MAQHTEGPWEADGISVRSEGADGRQIALCEITVRGRPYNETYDEAIANARLIAVAPDLLEMIKAIKRHGELACVDAHPGSYFNHGGKKPATKDVFQFPRHMLTELDAAIAKAEGRS